MSMTARTTRREFMRQVTASAGRATMTLTGATMLASCGTQGPASPTAPSPAPITGQGQYPTATCWGTRIGSVHTVQSGTTLRDALIAARLSPVFDRNGLMTSFDGNTPPRGLIVLVRGQYHASAVGDIRVSAGDTFAVYNFSGTHPTGTSGGATTCG